MNEMMQEQPRNAIRIYFPEKIKPGIFEPGFMILMG